MRTIRSAQPSGRSLPPPARDENRPGRQLLVGLELVTGAAALVGGILLAAAPDGSLLQMDPSALGGSPFTNWRLPGVALASLVGGGFLAAGMWERSGGSRARELSVLAGLSLVAFEGLELVWIGPHPLQLIFAIVGAAVAALAVARTPA